LLSRAVLILKCICLWSHLPCHKCTTNGVSLSRARVYHCL